VTTNCKGPRLKQITSINRAETREYDEPITASIGHPIEGMELFQSVLSVSWDCMAFHRALITRISQVLSRLTACERAKQPSDIKRTTCSGNFNTH